MRRIINRISRKIGLPPGSLVHVGEVPPAAPRIRIIDYDETRVQEREAACAADCFSFRDTGTATWINIDGVHDAGLVESIGNHFGLHPLVMEDILHTGQRPKLEAHDGYIYLVLRMLRWNEKVRRIDSEQVSIILGANFVISFQEREGDVFDPVRERIRNAGGRVRKHGADYLAYLLLDAIVDAYFPILETIEDEVEDLEPRAMDDPGPGVGRAIQRLRTELILLRKPLWPLREMISGLQRAEFRLVSAGLKPFLADVYDHTIQVIDATEALRDLVGGLRDTHLSSVSNRMNEIMKVLTVIATIFIPITFVAGVYGMNFDYMPGTGWRWGFFAALAAMAGIAAVMLFYFRRKKWL